ncbi:NAD(P)-binding protein [Saitoella complicata NRRL Y-17804]|uniref:NAD(P)-binding protein n=1 Tax=Saitoella complicata (strain BCRC 22490 / CBS 7301 / JCM 7358 / NBRC 10748 / NRRL Y-17804) TaxID=698492 RepID=UPI000867A3B4|nr:NAD(P)-binding protein [Saitoella complicata NRRL Y-17804]ODQ49934.1 NAD(P)-binding protein [Saitoella complicata NRRL Y-17804]
MTTTHPGTALITGAASGIGKATAFAFAKAGANLALADYNLDLLCQTAESIHSAYPSSQILTLQVDIASEDAIRSMITQTVAKYSTIDYAINNAGRGGQAGTSHALSSSDFDSLNAVNYRGTWLCVKYEIEQMLKQPIRSVPGGSGDERRAVRGSIVNVASQLGLVGRSSAPIYVASKHAVIGFTKCDAIDYAKDKIRINCVCPGVVETPMTEGAFEDAVSITPMGRKGLPEEIADAVVFLSGESGSFCCGSALVVDGGYVIN